MFRLPVVLHKVEQHEQRFRVACRVPSSNGEPQLAVRYRRPSRRTAVVACAATSRQAVPGIRQRTFGAASFIRSGHRCIAPLFLADDGVLLFVGASNGALSNATGTQSSPHSRAQPVRCGTTVGRGPPPWGDRHLWLHAKVGIRCRTWSISLGHGRTGYPPPATHLAWGAPFS